MSSSLDDVFDKILLSEQKANERKTQINQARFDIQKNEKDIIETGNSLNILTGQIAIKVQKWNETDLILNCLASKEKILQEQKEKLSQCHQEVKDKLKKERSESDKSHNEFREKVHHFMNSYDFISDGKRKRDEQAKAHLQAAKEEEQELLKELEKVGKHEERIRTLQANKKGLDEDMLSAKKHLTELEARLDEEESRLVVLIQERDSIVNQPQSDPAFLSLQAELEASKTDNLEEVCVALQLELQELQQLQWQKQVQMRQNDRPAKKFGFKRTRSGEGVKTSQHNDDTGIPGLSSKSQSSMSASNSKPNLARLTAAINKPEGTEYGLTRSSHP